MIVQAGEFTPGIALCGVGLVPRPQGRRKKYKEERELFNIVSAFDIETTTFHLPILDGAKQNAHAAMYIWMWQFGPKYTVIGRTWDEFLNVCRAVQDFSRQYAAEKKMNKMPLLCCYIHNAAFEWQFLAGIYPFTADEVFFTKPRKPLYFRMFDCLEYRCSYKLSNMSLAKFAESVGAETRKQSGQLFDYSKIRYADTPLTPDELLYCVDDVIALEESVRLLMEREGDDLRTLPYTSTGFVRRDCKAAISHLRRYTIAPMLPTVAQYRLLRAAFRGGNTHANARMVGKVLDGVVSFDMASCYPAQQLTKKFPMKPFAMLNKGGPVDMMEILRLIGRGYAVVGQYKFIGLRLKNPDESIPYLSLAKTESTRLTYKVSADGSIIIEDMPGYYDAPGPVREYGIECDNGRILRAGCSSMALTEIDLQIVLDTYKFDAIYCTKAMFAWKDMLPAEYRAVVQEYFNRKTDLKAAAKAEEKTGIFGDASYMYAKSKNRLNSVYGMSATDPIHGLVELDLTRTDGEGGEFIVSDYDTEGIEEELGKAPFPYQWGVYCTAYARQALQIAIKAAGDRMVYCDTDSIKTLGEIDLSQINETRQALAEQYNCGCADAAGEMHYPGVFERDGEYLGGFITQGAKRYAYRAKPGTDPAGLHVTVSGVTHKLHEYYNDAGELVRTVPYCNEELGDLSNFRDGMLWVKAGGTAAVYNDTDDFVYLTPDGHDVHFTRNVAIIETTYKMGFGSEYGKLLEILNDSELYRKWRHDHE